MEQFDFLRDLLVIYTIAGLVVFVAERLRVPTIVGLLVAGVIVGPYGLSLVDDLRRVELLAEIGVVLLLFTVGLEFTRERLAGAGHLLGAGMLQVLVAIAGTIPFILMRADFWGQAVFAGFLVAHTSTTVMLKYFLDRGEMATPAARISLAISIVQDLSVVWMIVLIPTLRGDQADWASLVSTLALGCAIVASILVVARYLLPTVLFQVARLRSRELFVILITVVSMGMAWLTASAGLSLALGAFLAGVALAESEYSHQALAEAIPFRDIFVSLFFVSIGMLFDAHFVLRHPVAVVGMVAGVVLLKFASGAIPALLFGYSWRVAVISGLAMAQIGEFAFVLSRPGRDAGLLPDEAYQALLAAAIITMGLSPFLMRFSPKLLHWGEHLPGLSRWLLGRRPDQEGSEKRLPRGHVIAVGYGVNGRNLVRALRKAEIPYIVLELSPVRVRRAREAGEPVAFGDCTRPSILEAVGIRHARMLVAAISDPWSARRAVQIARQMNPELRIVVRTRYLKEVDPLRAVGASDIIPEEFETSIEILSRVLDGYEVPHEIVRELIAEIRQDVYGLFRREEL
jgi:CPA2 family monovalent cation:H+ antiporter-2